MDRLLSKLLVCMALLAVSPGVKRVFGEDATTPGRVTTPSPTIVNLAIEWHIQGDDDLDGAVSVRYRKVGEPRWRDAMPLRRVPAGRSSGTRPTYEWENKHSGSIFDLRPDTAYEIDLRLTDPDGGSAAKLVRARTRPVPGAEGGELVLLPPGNHGTLDPESGTPERPMIYRSPDGEAVYEQINLRDKKWVHIEGVTVKNTKGGRDSKGVVMNGAEHCVVRRSRINAVFGIVAYRPGATDCYIADNVIEGTTKWTSSAMGARGKNIGEGIQMTGSGNVICHNRVTGFRDCISTMEDTGVRDQFCIDIYNNDIYVGADDGIEADFCFHNCRVVRNRMTNCFVGLSSQPGLGGPTYFIRNVMYNLTYVPFKLHRTSVGDVILHNTTVKVGDGMACFSGRPFDHALFRNNLSIGGPTDTRWGGYGAGSGMAARINAHGPHCSFDYDAIGTYQTPFRARIGASSFSEAEPHGLRVDMSVFQNVPFPTEPVPGYEPPDLRPLDGSKVVDAAIHLPNVGDGFRGAAPDIGAYEVGQPLPVYGPRPAGVDEETDWRKRGQTPASKQSKNTP